MASFPSSRHSARGTSRAGAGRSSRGIRAPGARPGSSRPPPGGLAAALHALGDALDRDLGDRLSADGWPAISPTRLRLLEHAAPPGTGLPALSRALGVSRQAVHQLVCALRHDGLVTAGGGQETGRPRPVVLTDRGIQLVSAARAHRAELEQDLERRLGAEGAQALESLFALVRSAE